ncbi:MAG TPA: DUF3048 domain-containing protein [Actinomycetes bacterium]|nr:DUF3048 domain-containing protein [Actinomycetes bacterium]
MTPASRLVPVRAGTAVALGLALVLTACSSDAEPGRTTARDTSTPSVTPTTPPPPPQPSTLSGRMGREDQPVFAVKIDNTAQARPQQGLQRADVVYVEQVEGGVTRLAAIYSSQYPRYVGPVRSARITDIELLRQYGRVGLIYSGSQTRLHDNLVQAQLGLVSFDRDRTGYTRAPSRPQPYDVIGTFDRLRKRAGTVDLPKSVGYAFGDPPLGGKPAKEFTAQYPGARVSGTWSAKADRWLLSMDGVPARAAEGGQLGPTTFIVQYATIKPSSYRDVNGANTPLTKTVGKGKALFFRDGQVYRGKWSRAKAWQPTTYTIDGQPAVLAPGQIWVALVGRGAPVSIR